LEVHTDIAVEEPHRLFPLTLLDLMPEIAGELHAVANVRPIFPPADEPRRNQRVQQLFARAGVWRGVSRRRARRAPGGGLGCERFQFRETLLAA